jgi:hypothetical protein
MNSSWRDYFQPGETLVWQGAPKPGSHGLAKIVALALFGLPFLVLGIGICITGLGMLYGVQGWQDAGLGLFFTTFGVPFAGVGAVLVFGQAYAAHQAHRKIRYALSARAAYVAKSWWTRSIEAYPILRSTPTGLEKGRWANTVWFHVRSEKDQDGDRSTTRVAFDNIVDGESVFRLICAIQTGGGAQ